MGEKYFSPVLGAGVDLFATLHPYKGEVT